MLEERPLLRKYMAREVRPKLNGMFGDRALSIHTHCLGKRSTISEARTRPVDLGEDSVVETVRGKYFYFHYGQDGETDAGWGCAYRSLQTLASWFVCQGYSESKVPSILEIQKALIELKDKPAKFAGSTAWIGAYEVMLCLNHFLKVESKILNLGSGGAIASNAATILGHFRTQGTPIMIGGGEYAYTILGIECSAATGEVMLLILDPHYTGTNETYSHVIQKGGCKWRKCDMFRVDTFYNLCLPSVPKFI